VLPTSPVLTQTHTYTHSRIHTHIHIQTHTPSTHLALIQPCRAHARKVLHICTAPHRQQQRARGAGCRHATAHLGCEWGALQQVRCTAARDELLPTAFASPHICAGEACCSRAVQAGWVAARLGCVGAGREEQAVGCALAGNSPAVQHCLHPPTCGKREHLCRGTPVRRCTRGVGPPQAMHPAPLAPFQALQPMFKTLQAARTSLSTLSATGALLMMAAMLAHAASSAAVDKPGFSRSSKHAWGGQVGGVWRECGLRSEQCTFCGFGSCHTVPVTPQRRTHGQTCAACIHR